MVEAAEALETKTGSPPTLLDETISRSPLLTELVVDCDGWVTEQHRLLQAEKVATDAYDLSKKYEGGGCFGEGRVIDEDRDLRQQADQAKMSQHHGTQAWLAAREGLFNQVLDDKAVTDIERLALLEALLSGKVDDRAERYAQTLGRLNELDQQLQPGQTVAYYDKKQDYFIQLGEEAQGLVIIIDESGVRVKTPVGSGYDVIEGQSMGDNYRIGPRSHSDGITLFGATRDKVGRTTVYDELFGGDIGLHVASLPAEPPVSSQMSAGRESYGRHAARIVAGFSLGMDVPGIDTWSEVNQAQFDSALLNSLYARVGNKVLAGGSKQAEYATRANRLEVWLMEENEAALSAITRYLRYSPDGLKRRIEKQITEAEEKLLAGQLPATELPYIQVAQRRLDHFVRELFADAT